MRDEVRVSVHGDVLRVQLPYQEPQLLTRDGAWELVRMLILALRGCGDQKAAAAWLEVEV